MKYLFYMLMIFVFLQGSIYADCWYNGKYYPIGTVINGKTCQSDGVWR